MPYDSENKRLYVDTSVTPNIGISLKNISDCLRDYRRNSKGAIDLGMMCTSPNVNMWALYRPYNDYNNIVSGATLEDRKNSNYGLIINSEVDADDSMFVRTTYEKNIAAPYRIADFNGYDGLAECGFSIIPLSAASYPSSSSMSIRMVGETGYNIGWSHLSDILEGTNAWDNILEFGVELRSNKGSIPLLRKAIGKHSEVESALKSSYNVAISALKDCPKGDGAIMYIYGLNSVTGQTHMFGEPLGVKDERNPDTFNAGYHHFAPNMQIGTFNSGMKTVNEWWKSGQTIVIGSNDFFRMGFYIRNESSNTFIFQPRLKVTIGSSSYYLRVYYMSEDATISIGPWASLGPTSYSGMATFYCSYADFADILGYATTKKAKIQLCNIDITTQTEYIITPPIELSLMYNGNDASGRDEYPDFPPIPEPDWSGGFDI